MQHENVTTAGIAVLALILACAAMPAEAATARARGKPAATEYPARPIRFVVTFPPGGGTDVLARLLGAEMTVVLGQQVIIDNRPGASGNIGAEIVAKAQPDGYTLLMVNSTFAINASVFTRLPFDTLADFAPVIMVASVPSVLAVNPRLPVKSVKELIGYARAHSGKLAYASCGSGTPQHLAGELFKSMSRIDLTHVPYKGCAPALLDVLAGQVDVSFNTVANTMPHVRTGKLRALGVTSGRKYPPVPELPTIAEAGLPGYDVDQWFGVLAPAGTPRPVIARLNTTLAAVVQRPDIHDKLLQQSFEPLTSTPERFGAVIKSDVARWQKLVRDLGLKVD